MYVLHDIFIAFCYIAGILVLTGLSLGLLGGIVALWKKNKR